MGGFFFLSQKKKLWFLLQSIKINKKRIHDWLGQFTFFPALQVKKMPPYPTHQQKNLPL